MDPEKFRQRLERKARQVAENSPGIPPPRRPSGSSTLEAAAPPESFGMPEAVIKWYRPVLVVTDDKFVRSETRPDGDNRFIDPDAEASRELLDALEAGRAILDPAIRSVGRIELTGNLRYPWVGTGWIIGGGLGEDIIVTNAHVAREFAMASKGAFVFRPGVPDISKPQSAHIDFREELGGAAAREFPITGIVWVSEVPGLDMALLKVAREAGDDRIDPPIGLQTDDLAGNRMLAVIGFPGSNNGYEMEPFEKLFGRILGKKRFSPGYYTGVRSGSATYDCSTLPGSSGSLVLDVATGRAAGLHFAGTAFDTNYAVTAQELARVLSERPWQGETVRAARPKLGDTAAGIVPGASQGAVSGDVTLAVPDAGGGVSLTLPLHIVVRLGQPAQGTAAIAGTSAGTGARDRVSAEAAAQLVQQHLKGDPAVLNVKADYLFRDGVLSDDYGVIVAVAPGSSLDPAAHDLGARLNGVEIAVETADPATIAEEQLGIVPEAFAGRQAEYERDLGDARFDLSPVTGRMKIKLHVSPEAGWPVLRDFLADADGDELTIGMYHMTAPHIVEAIEEVVKRRVPIKLTLDRQRGDLKKNPDDTTGETKKNDIPERDTLKKFEGIAGSRFNWAPASLGGSGLFASAYHIKVAVWATKKGNKVAAKKFWLSSGNWQSSNQPGLQQGVDEISTVTWGEVADYNREWHAIVEHDGLAETMRQHLLQDYEDNLRADREEEAVAALVPDVLVPVEMLEKPRRVRDFRPFAPHDIDDKATVQILLTPDNYPETIARLISEAKDRVLIENQSFNFWSDLKKTPAHFLKIATAVKNRQKAGLDVRIIFRNSYGSEREILRNLKKFGIKADDEHARYFDKCHNKGIVIDDDIVILGSQNFTAAGTGPNRDASLVIWHKEANEYFRKVFEHDWNNVATNRADTEMPDAAVQFVPAGAEVPTPAGYRRISLAEFLGET